MQATTLFLSIANSIFSKIDLDLNSHSDLDSYSYSYCYNLQKLQTSC